jgi:Ras-related protein Rab-23
VCIVVFSTVDRDSFNNVEKWIGKVLKECGQIPMVIVQNKTDLMDEAQVSKEEAEKLAHKLNLTLFRTCVKDNINVSQVFQYLAKKFCNQGLSNFDLIPKVFRSKEN